MISDNPAFVTIIIPTYNRGQCLSKNLRILLPQVLRHSDEVKVYISDNNSDDDTEGIVNSFIAKYGQILTYFKQKENIGGNPNMHHAISKVNAKYVCLLGDDDYVRPQYIDTILELLHNNPDVALVNVNGLCITENGEYCGTRDKQVVESDILFYKRGQEFILHHLEVPSLISSNLFVRDSYLTEYEKINPLEYPGYDWFYAMLCTIINKPVIYYGFPLIEVTCASSGRWAKELPLYYIVGLGNTFQTLEKEVVGINERWKKFFRSSELSEHALRCVIENREVNKRIFWRLNTFSPSNLFSLKLLIASYFPSVASRIMLKAIRVLWRIFR